MISISIESDYAKYSLYNVILMCGGFNDSSEKLYVTSAQKGENETFTELTADDTHHIEVIIYVVPTMLPKGKNVEVVDHPPFAATIKIESNGETKYLKEHQINAWGGAAIKLNLEI